MVCAITAFGMCSFCSINNLNVSLFISYSKNCPITLKNYLMQTALKRTLEKCKSSPKDCGYDEERQSEYIVIASVILINNFLFYFSLSTAKTCSCCYTNSE